MMIKLQIISGILLVFGLLVPAAVAQSQMRQLLDNGPRDQRINIVLLSEGYTQADLARFPRDAQAILDTLFTEPPYDTYAPYFNAFIISVASAESGSDHPSRNEFKNTYFNSTYDCGGLQRLICIGGQGWSRAVALLQTYVPEFDMVLFVVNDTQYGGAGGGFAVTSVNASGIQVAIHEFGHSFAWLADEYDYGESRVCAETANTTAETNRSLIRWNHWIQPGTPIPTPEIKQFDKVIGLFEGASYQPTGCYRPQLHCLMEMLGVPFCAVCLEQHLRAIYTFLSPIAARDPTAETLFPAPDEVITLRITPMRPATHALQIQWYINGKPVAEAADAVFTFSTSDLPTSIAEVSVRVTDPVSFVTNPLILPLLQDTATWQVSLENNAPIVINPIPDIELWAQGPSFVQPMKEVFFDPDGDILLFTAQSEDLWIASASLLNDTLRVQAYDKGSTRVLLTANDGRFGQVEYTFGVNVPTGVGSTPVDEILPVNYEMAANYPNPFSQKTHIPFALPRPENLSLKVYDVLGRPVAVLAQGLFAAGHHQVIWDASGWPSGVYFVRLEAGTFTQSRQLLLRK